MDEELRRIVANYGFKAVHSRLVETMREEYEFLKAHFDMPLYTNPSPPENLLQASVEIPAEISQKKKIRKTRKVQPKENLVTLPSENEPEVKDVIVNVPESTTKFRDPKDIKEFQRSAEDAKRKENDAAGLQILQILTKENLKKWIEDEGRTYAWVAREKAGCPDTQVAATAQMMGIKSKITKKRGTIIGKNVSH